jgi:hypothetical protein
MTWSPDGENQTEALTMKKYGISMVASWYYSPSNLRSVYRSVEILSWSIVVRVNVEYIPDFKLDTPNLTRFPVLYPLVW